MKVIKRDGREVDYCQDKIVIAITKAAKAATGKLEMKERTIKYVADMVEDDIMTMDHSPTIEEIQELVETHLMRVGAYETAKRYVRYRQDRANLRSENTTDARILSLLANNNRELAEENANKSTVIAATQRDYIAGEVSRDLTRRKLMPEYIARAHDEGAIHFHK